RHGAILGMGACALVVESEDVVRQRGMRGIVEVLSTETRNSAFHGSRLDVDHIAMVMNDLVTTAERRFGLNRYAIAPQLVFMSHETFTPARGGSASAEVAALRHTFGEATDDIIVANTKGFTGHPMGVGVEDVIALKILEYGIVPPVPNYREVDDELGILNLSRGGRYPVQYALHLAAGFGSQIALTLLQRIPGALDRVDNKPRYQCWLDDVSGYDRAETEIEKRVLRIKAQGAPRRIPAPSNWQVGTGPAMRTQASNGSVAAFSSPAHMVVPEVGPIPGPVKVEPISHPIVSQPVPQAVAPAAPEPDVDDRQLEPLTAVIEGVAVTPEPVIVREAATMITSAADPVTNQVLQIVAEQTGYPIDMLDLDLDLEADLGVDTVKQAETFVAIRQAFDIPRQDNLQLRDYPTLARVIKFVEEMRPDLAGEQLAVSSEQLAVGPSKTQDEQPAVIEAAGVEALPIAEKVLAIVAEQTGYPTEMLELDLDLEADLGVDTVKQAETFMAIRQAFDIPRLDNLQLRDYPTLGHVIGFVEEMRPDLTSEQLAVNSGQSTVGSEQSAVAETPVMESPPITDDWLLITERVPRRVPVPSLRSSLDLCKPTGVTLDENSRVVVMMDSGGVGKTLAGRLEKLGVTALALEASLAAEELEAQLKTWLADAPIQGVYWLPALDVEPNLEELELESWRELNRQRVKNLYVTMRALYDVVSEPGTFLLAATRLGGLHGYGPEAAIAPLGGAVTGFTKAYKREHPEVLVKAVDFEASRKTAQPADALIAETLADPGVVEVSYWQNQRYTVTLLEQPAGENEDLRLDDNTVFLVTGAAGGITSAIIADLAAASSGTFYLLDLVPEPERTDARITLFRQSRDSLKQQLIEEAKARGERPTPVTIEKQLMAVERQEAALRAIESVEAAGGTACYRSVNLLDDQAVTAVIDEIRQKHDRIDVLIHAAGLEISRSLPDKDPAQFDLVFDVKADGFFNLLKAAKGLPVGATLAFSSVAGRFGNSGQTDYSAANDLLCKVSSSLRRWRPKTRGIVIDWTAWAGIGMATRGSIPKIMEMAGIEMLPPEVGIPTVRRELITGGQGEIVVAGALGVLTEEWDTTGGLDVDKANAWLAGRKPQWPMIGQVRAARVYGGLDVETILDPKIQPFLYDHAMDGTPLLPGVMGTEAFAELASTLAPDYTVAAVTHEQFQAPFKFYRMEPQTLYLSATATPTNNGDLLVHTVLKSVRKLAQPGLPDQEKVHFTADVHLTCTPTEEPAKVTDLSFPAEGERVNAEDIYRIYFHGPAYQVLEWVQVDGDQGIGLMAENLPPNTDPADAASLIAPRLIELCFQTAGIWEMKNKGVLALPLAIQSVTAYRQAEAADGKRLYALVKAVNDGQRFNAQVVDEIGNVYVALSGYRTVQLPGKIEIGA
ncbi:MAG TPA: SDR family NAD(P)-dependent oxidoreductase, partial [Anaerolineae bacterium]